MLFEKLWKGACNILEAGTGQGTRLNVITCLPLSVPEPPEVDPQPPASITVVLLSTFLFSSLPRREEEPK